ncbi:diguanylate cyclase [Actinoplanes sp. NPDC026619]|uniref:GGDEF domain-containing protein n=1 Tax=Actinoplanes sp. NPDC026619 TaxID=3155798 RepID=UPI0033CE697A
MSISWRTCLGVGTAATIAYSLLPAVGWWHAAGFGLVGVACVAVVLHAVRRYRPQQVWTWYTFVAGLAVWAANSVIDQLTTAEPWSAISGSLSVAGYPLMCVALAGLIRGRARTDDRTALVDGGIVAASLGLLGWLFLGGDLSIEDPLHLVVGLLMAVGDIALFVLASLLITTPGARTGSFRLLIAGLLTTALGDFLLIADTSSGPYQGGAAGVAYMLANVLGATAAVHPSMRRLTVPPANPPSFVRPRLALLTVAILLAPAVSIYLGVTGRIAQEWAAPSIGCVVLFLLVTVRMAGLVSRVEKQARRLERLANHDALTGLANRRRWDERLHAAMAECAATGDTLTVGLIDLDHFKRYNDTHGHQAGDELLSRSAIAWLMNLREGDLLARYGGEEFGLLLTAHTPAEAAGVVERLMAATPHGQSFSAGLAQWDGQESPEELLHRADLLLYASKGAGRARLTSDAVPAGV